LTSLGRRKLIAYFKKTANSRGLTLPLLLGVLVASGPVIDFTTIISIIQFQFDILFNHNHTPGNHDWLNHR